MIHDIPLLFEESAEGRRGVSLPKADVPKTPVPENLRRETLALPELSESQVVRHFTRLSQKNFSVDGQFYPLGSCTMKYNPRMNEEAASYRGFRLSHPLAPDKYNQGNIALLWHLQEAL
ncbi:MAG: aminomethyl-transferring glycine dehydrogenase subunit GcvPB, partial [Treponema sp.]|nr:aminomethyl-transferring glycine dehydrogenase subunit GcvPB [Treponema sp.]